MNGLPDGIDVGDFVGEKFHNVENASNCEDERMGENLKMFGKMNNAEALEQTESRDGGVEVEAGGKTGAEDEAESFERAHGSISMTFRFTAKFQSTTKETGPVNE